MQVPVLRIPFSEDDREFLHEGLDEILDSGFLTMGEKTDAFESAFADFVGAEETIACDSGTSAIELALRGLEIEGSSVVVPTNTFMATAHAVVNAGNRVTFADSKPSTLGLDPEDLRTRIDDDTEAVVLVHIGGVISEDVDEILEICEEHDLALIEDAAHAHGATIDGRQAGTLGDVGAFSFFPTKVATTGEGGMVTTDDQDLAARIRMVRNHGKNPERDDRITEQGSNFRMSELQALLGLQQVRALSDNLADRHRIAGHYDEALADVPGLEPLSLPDRISSSYYKYIVYLDEEIDREAVKSGLADRDVSATGEVYARLCHDAPLWDNYTYCGQRRGADGEPSSCDRWPDCGCDEGKTGYPGAQNIRDTHMCLPSYPGLSEDELDYVVDSLREVMAERTEASS